MSIDGGGNRRRGFTLIEVVVAVVLLSVGTAAAHTLSLGAIQRLHRVQRDEMTLFEVAEIADSLALRAREIGGGERERPWGWIRWATDTVGLQVWADPSAGPRFSEVVVRLRVHR